VADLAIVCPTRNRPDLCRAMIESARRTSDADLLLYVDRDDQHLARYGGYDPKHVKLVVGDPIGRGRAVNALCETYPNYRAYLMVSDDITFDRKGWDKEALAALDGFKDEIGLVHLESEVEQTYANWAMVSRKWIETLGWFNYPGCNWFCQDTIVQVLAQAIGRITLIEPQVLTHHVTHTPDVIERLRQDQDAFLWYMAKNFASDLAKLREAIA
jgi:hypothetical protein